MRMLLFGIAALSIVASSPSFARATGSRTPHADAMRGLRQECAQKTGAQIDPSFNHVSGSPSVMAAFRSCMGG